MGGGGQAESACVGEGSLQMQAALLPHHISTCVAVEKLPRLEVLLLQPIVTQGEIQLWSPVEVFRQGEAGVEDVHQHTPRAGVHGSSFTWMNPPHLSRGALFLVLEGGWRSSKEVEAIESVGQGGAPGARYICGVIVKHFLPFHMESVPGASGRVSLWLWTWKLYKFEWSRSSEPNKVHKACKDVSFPFIRPLPPRVSEQLSVCLQVPWCVGGILVFSIDLLCSHIWISALTQTLTDAEAPEQFVPHPANASLCKIRSYFLCPQPFLPPRSSTHCETLRSLFNSVNSNRFHQRRN